MNGGSLDSEAGKIASDCECYVIHKPIITLAVGNGEACEGVGSIHVGSKRLAVIVSVSIC